MVLRFRWFYTENTIVDIICYFFQLAPLTPPHWTLWIRFVGGNLSIFFLLAQEYDISILNSVSRDLIVFCLFFLPGNSCQTSSTTDLQYVATVKKIGDTCSYSELWSQLHKCVSARVLNLSTFPRALSTSGFLCLVFIPF